jgi:hypothetical protein
MDNMRSPRKKILFWFTAIALIMACVPSMAAPAPVAPLDPNAISTFIAQTAEAASTQTAAAIPVFTSTATFTVTPPSTFTPESTYTPVGLITFPTPTPVERDQLYRFKHDYQLAYYNYKSRTSDNAWPVEQWGLQTTEMVELWVDRKMKAGTHRTKLNATWDAYIDLLNNYNPRKLHYVKANDTALFDGAGFPQLESVSMGGNVITLDEIKDGWGRVNTFDFDPGSLEGINYITRPDLVHKFVVIGWDKQTRTSYITDPPPPYGDLYWPLVSSREVWVPMEFLEAFPPLPMVVTGVIKQEIKQKPEATSSSTGFTLAVGATAQVVEYYPSGSDVWGRLSSGGWIALLQHPKAVITYMTDWKMETRPPIPPPAVK